MSDAANGFVHFEFVCKANNCQENKPMHVRCEYAGPGFGTMQRWPLVCPECKTERLELLPEKPLSVEYGRP